MFPHVFITLMTSPTRRPPKSMHTEYPLTPPKVPANAARLRSTINSVVSRAK